MARGDNEILDSIDRGMPAFKILYDEDSSTTTTYEEGTDWGLAGDKSRPKFIDINNTGASDLTFQTNDDGDDITVKAGEAFGALSIVPYISKVVVTATDSFVILLRK